MKNPNLIKAEVTSIKQVTPKIKTFRLHYGNQAFRFNPGQWIDLHAPLQGKNIGGYTIISSTRDRGFIDLAVRESLNHPVTKYLHETIRVGDFVQITEGQGKFFLNENLLTASLILIAGGIGITPLLSMIRSHHNPERIKLFYSVSNEEEILFRNELSPLATFTVTKSHQSNWSGPTTRINLEFLKNYQANLNSHFFICGPKEMIDHISSELKQNNIPETQIHFEKWW